MEGTYGSFEPMCLLFIIDAKEFPLPTKKTTEAARTHPTSIKEKKIPGPRHRIFSLPRGEEK
eukprot:1159631-Pelagomonas_calceolata.AAC.8